MMIIDLQQSSLSGDAATADDAASETSSISSGSYSRSLNNVPMVRRFTFLC